ncbi:hypothetical protein FJU08_09890 [Martelella alba]|uniref:Uncharacterized protein n=1 Tax=Martelella alba TaxID=2590451 RepID=A0A506UCW4_9HYPH|nr:hypothetical protein [Martelella alba]TPW30961.1 hypothetical protein FJU08_09890 [Martelella alba]
MHAPRLTSIFHLGPVHSEPKTQTGRRVNWLIRTSHRFEAVHPALKAFLAINLLLPAIYTFYIVPLSRYPQTSILEHYNRQLLDGLTSEADLLERPEHMLVPVLLPLAVLLGSFLMLQALNLVCIMHFSRYRCLFCLTTFLNLLALPLGQISFPAIAASLPFILFGLVHICC